ncbi:MAG: hypothetical protein JWR72_2828 [Flavisolibacter sp.]|jgi:hypothetical protein|nr:hypothetical protein [Flavisolibacter sp.]
MFFKTGGSRTRNIILQNLLRKPHRGKVVYQFDPPLANLIHNINSVYA